MGKKENPAALEERARAYKIARENGFMSVNDDEAKLINTLRQTNWHGRDMVYEFAKVSQRLNPWIRGEDEGRNTYQFQA